MRQNIWNPILLIVLIASGAFFSCTPTSGISLQEADSLNVLAYQLRYKDLAASSKAADEALKAAHKSGAQRAEAYNNLAFCAFMKMDFDRSEYLFQLVYEETTSELERLIADVGMMKICQRTGMNKEFYDYRNSALRRIKRIQDDYASLSTPHELARFSYGKSDFHLTTAIYHYYLQQEQQSIEALDEFDLYATTSGKDSTQLLYSNYLRGIGILHTENYEDRVIEEFSNLIDLLGSSHDQGFLYFEGSASQALSQLFQRDRAFSVLQHKRPNLLRMINPRDLPQDSLMLTFAQRALELFSQYGDYYQISSSYLTLSACYTKRGSYDLALENLTKALSYVNFHHEIYYHCTDTLDRLQTYSPSDSTSLELKWITQDKVKTIPEWIARLREQLSMTYAAMGMKPESDYNRNLYLDILDYTRQDKELLSRYKALEKESIQLTAWLFLVVVGGVLLLFCLGWLNNLWRTRNALYIGKLNSMLAICKRITASVPLHAVELEDVAISIQNEVGDELLQLLGANRLEIKVRDTDAVERSGGEVFPLYTPDNSHVVGELHLFSEKKLKKDAYSLIKVIAPYMAWTLENGLAMIHLTEERERLEKEQYVWEKRLSENKRQNVIKRACLFLVTGITPYMDRIINEVHKLVRYDYLSDKQLRQEKFHYVGELVGCINEYNEMLTKWIRMRQGSLSLSIEVFEVQSLFDLLQKGRKTYEMKQQSLEILPTTSLVKADKALTLFMLNTLADNARKYTQIGGMIRISATETDDYVELSVADNGPGLSCADVEAILADKIYDASRIGIDSSTDREALMHQKGSGFGLMNCKGIIEKYRKTNELFRVCTFSISSQLGKGSCFSFRLPKGVKRIWLWLFICVLSTACQVDNNVSNSLVEEREVLSTPPIDSLLMAANRYVYSAYDANVAGKYNEALCYADSTLRVLNEHYLLHTHAVQPLLVLVGQGRSAELLWLSDSVDTDYYTLLDVRNEAAVAFLALGNLDAYRYNNNAYTTLYKQLSEDVSLEEYCQKMQISSTNKSIAIVICFILLFILLIGYYILYLRKHLFHQFSLEQVLNINKKAFQALQTTRQEVGAVAQQLVNELFQEVNELIPIHRLGMAICSTENGELHYAFSDVSEEANSLMEIMSRSYINKSPIWKENSSFRAIPLFVERCGEKSCIGVLALHVADGWKQEDDRIMLELVAGYIAVLVHTALVLMEQKYRDIESANDESRRIQREESLLHVQNLVLDNCLSTIKHETVYYPNKVKQLIEKLDDDEWEDTDVEQVKTIGELMDYYKEVFTLLTSCAARQLEEVTFRRSVVEAGQLANYAKRYFAKLIKRQRRELTLTVESQDVLLIGDVIQLRLLLECLINEAVATKEDGELALSIYAVDNFVRFDFTDYRRNYTQEELNQLFFPQLARIKQEASGLLGGTEFLICKQIIREHDEFAGKRGCRINAESTAQGVGYTIWCTIPLKNNRN